MKPKHLALSILLAVAAIGAVLFLSLPSPKKFEGVTKPMELSAPAPTPSPVKPDMRPKDQLDEKFEEEFRKSLPPEIQQVYVKNADWIGFYNSSDKPPALPFLKVIFHGLPPENANRVGALQEAMGKELKDLGDVNTDADYKKLEPVIVKHSIEMTRLGASMVRIEFPRVKKGITLYQKK
jgi:hypothetical protein